MTSTESPVSVRGSSARGLTVRELRDDDAEPARQLGYEAFGLPPSAPTEPASVRQPGRSWFGAFDGETLIGRMVDREYESFFGGAAIPTAGIAGVTVAAEHRGRGALSPLLAATLTAAKARGAMISTLFPTAPRIYRRFGYEVVADFVTVQVSTQVLASVSRPEAVSRPETVRTRRAVADDFDAIRGIYDAWASEQNGPLTRRGVSFVATAVDYLASFTGVTVAVDDADVVRGFASWHRGQGFGAKAVLEISDLLAVDADGYRALLIAMGSFASVAPRATLDTSGHDLVRTFLDTSHWQVVDREPYMLKLLDVGGALRRRRYPAGFSARLAFQLKGDFLPENDGGYVLETSAGEADCPCAELGGHVFTPQGLALLYAGTLSCANLRSAGHLSGGAATDDGVWDALFGGRQPHIRDYF